MKNKKLLMLFSICALGGIGNAANTVNPSGTTINTDVGGTVFVNNGDSYVNDGTITGATSYRIMWGDENTSITNNGTISGSIEAVEVGAINGIRSTFVNTGLIEKTAVSAVITNDLTVGLYNTDATNSSTGIIKGTKDAVRAGGGTTFINNGRIEAGRMGILSWDNENITNNGTIIATEYGVFTNGDGATVTNNQSGIINSQIGILGGGTGTITNNGTINTTEEGIVGQNTDLIINNGTINVTGTTPSSIVSGIRMGNVAVGPRIINTGTINSDGYAINMGGPNGVLELGNNTQITGIIHGNNGENIIISKGNINVGQDGSENIHKLVASGNTTITGRIDLDPSANDLYYTDATGSSKSLTNIASDTSIGNLTLKGTINVGVDYDGIVDDTDKTGKIIASSVILSGGNVTLVNAGLTEENIVTESGKDAIGDQLRVKSIVISNKQQAVNPDFKFNLSNELSGGANWKSETVSRIENGVTVLDELYTRIDTTPTPDPDPNPDPNPKPDPDPTVKKNAVPRNRVDLDNVNRLDSISGRFLNMESKDMNTGERRQSIEYIGTKGGSKFKADNEYNYDYDVDTDGISGTTLLKLTDNILGGFTLGYTSNDVTYSNNDDEKVNSFNINMFGRYVTGNFDIDGHLGYGFNEHTLNADWLGAGKLESNYNSHVLKGGATVGYNQEIGKGVKVRPNIGLDYVYVNEGEIYTNGLSNIDGTTGQGVVGKVGLDLGNTEGKLRWNLGVGYEQNFTDTFHEDRNMSNDYTMEELSYGKGTFKASADVDYRVTDGFALKLGYEYEKNDNYENNNVRAGFSFLLGEK
ncbi:MAG: autotransporter outer membrane beta-barrel domain-containing protein [Sebaldella sp.]|nr:autotransporter outer membrane beta-barrel domain-containing protein [Sebaldella sp.]